MPVSVCLDVCVCLKTNSPFVHWVTRGTCICVSHCITWCNMETATTVVTLWLTLGPLNPSSFYRSTSVSLVFFFPVSLSPDWSLASPSSSLSFSLLLCLSYNSWWFTSLLFFQFFQLCPLYDCETGLSTGYGWFSWWRGIHSMSKLTVFFSLALLCTLLYFAPSAGQRNKRATERESGTEGTRTQMNDENCAQIVRSKCIRSLAFMALCMISSLSPTVTRVAADGITTENVTINSGLSV